MWRLAVKRWRRAGLMCVLCCGMVANVGAQTEYINSTVERIALTKLYDGLNRPWGMTELADGSLLVTERRGRLLHLTDGNKHLIDGVPTVAAVGQGGLLDILVVSEQGSEATVVLTYSASAASGYSLIVVSAVVDVGTRRMRSEREIFRSNVAVSNTIHFGSRVALLDDGTLLITLGDRGNRGLAQDSSQLAGAVVRINLDGTIPDDNPFVGVAGAHPALFSIGHRNPQGLAVDWQGKIWLNEHGPQGGDEINLVVGGKNYGWPTVTYGKEYRSGADIGIGTSAVGYENPVVQWTPSIAPSGMIRYSGKMFSNWRGDLFNGALAGRELRRVVLAQSNVPIVVREERLLYKEIGRVRAVLEASDGAILLLTDDNRGALYRLSR